MQSALFPGLIVLLAAIAAGCGESAAERAAEASSKTADATTITLREDALASAHVWTPPAVPIPEVNLRENPPGPGAFSSHEEVSCRFTLEEVSGTTPKFYCELPGGEVIKIKYGDSNPELSAEVAATRLLSALGFGADRMYVVKRVNCAGCPRYPFQALRCLQQVGIRAACLAGGINYDRVIAFDAAVVERRLEGRKIEAPPLHVGWPWFELEKIDPARGGSSRAEVDALRLMAMLLAHWDNKAENQRLLCPAGQERADGGCVRPLAILQDVGATFGPVKAELHNWRNTRVWADAQTCTVSMKSLPWGGATFPDRTISEAGRLFVLDLLEQLTDRQLRDLFEGSRITAFEQVSGEGRNPDAWVRAFKDKVQQIRDAGPCGRN